MTPPSIPTPLVAADTERDLALEDAALAADAEAKYRRECQASAIKKSEARDFESMAIACVHVASAIRNLKSKATGQ